MFTGSLALDLLLGDVHSLKGKRSVVRPIVAELKLDLLRVEREFLFQLLREGRITDEARRRLERELDLEEAAIISRRGEESVLPL